MAVTQHAIGAKACNMDADRTALQAVKGKLPTQKDSYIGKNDSVIFTYMCNIAKCSACNHTCVADGRAAAHHQ
jgi:hypothetical protein